MIKNIYPILYKNLSNQLHRVDGPAAIYKHGKYWYFNGVLHRPDGPAIELSCGKKLWFINGKRLCMNVDDEKE